MITPSTIYWITRLDGIRDNLISVWGFLTFASVTAIVISAVLFLMSVVTGNGSYDVFSDKSDEELNKIHMDMRRWSWSAIKCGATGLALMFLVQTSHAFIPTTKEMAAIIVIPRIANSETVQQLGDEIVNLAQQWMQELAPKKEDAK